MYERELQEIGLTENEAKIYLVILRMGSATPSDIAKKTGLHRPYVYDALERLSERGVSSSVYVGKKRYFKAVKPEKLIDILKQKISIIQEIIPSLEKLTTSEKEDTEIEVHKGTDCLKIMLRDASSHTKRGGEVFVYGIDDSLLMTLEPLYLKQYFNTIKNKQISEKVIVKEGARKIPEAKTTKYKFLPKEFIGNIMYICYENKLAILTLGIPNYLIFIKNKDVADSYRKQFNLLWKIARS